MKRMISWTVLAALGMGPMTFGQTELEKQVSACGALTVCNITVPSGVNVVTSPWNLRDKTALTIRGDGSSTVIWFFAAEPPPTICLDTIGTGNLRIEGIKFALGNASKRPDALWVHGRGADSRSQELFQVSGVKFEGRFNKVLVALFAVENDEWHSVGFMNGAPNTPSLFMSRDNEIGLTSPYGPVRVNVAMMTSTNHVFVNCSFDHYGHEGLVAPMTNDLGFGVTLGNGVHDWVSIGGSTSQGARGGVLHVTGPNNRRVAVVSPNWEAESAKASIVVDGEVYGLSVRDGLLQANGPALRVNGTAANVTLCPAEMLTTSILQLGPMGKLGGHGLVTAGFTGR